MGQIKNIKLHIVTDIKKSCRPITEPLNGKNGDEIFNTHPHIGMLCMCSLRCDNSSPTTSTSNNQGSAQGSHNAATSYSKITAHDHESDNGSCDNSCSDNSCSNNGSSDNRSSVYCSSDYRRITRHHRSTHNRSTGSTEALRPEHDVESDHWFGCGCGCHCGRLLHILCYPEEEKL